MRYARALDYRRRLETKIDHWNTKVLHVSFKDIPGLGTGAVEFASPVSVICGPNGVGKSTILKLIWAALDPRRALTAPEHLAKLSMGSGIVQLERSAGRTSHAINFPFEREADADADVDCVHVDTASDVSRIQNIYANVTDLEAFINGAATAKLSDNEVSEISYLTWRSYDHINLIEVELADEYVPFFNVSLEGQEYDSRTMGSGEFAAFLLWWHLRRAERGSILLLEEPESFLSPNARKSFTNILLKFAFDQQIFVIMTSHSGEIITPLPAASVRFFLRESTNVVLATQAMPPALLEMIGINTTQDIIAFVEDEAAITFGRLWTETFNPQLAKRIIFHNKKSDGEIIKLIKNTQLRYGSVKVIGLFDGDAKAKINKNLADRSTFLPGDLPVEKIFREFVKSNVNLLIDRYGWGNLREILFSIQATDHHDWFEELAKSLGLPKAALFFSLYSSWIKDPSNEKISRAAFDHMLHILGEQKHDDGVEQEVLRMESLAVTGVPAAAHTNPS